jgi:BirA family biotin operon repressor/biotin-[acetyl-CoA-carboxylase] ligase
MLYIFDEITSTQDKLKELYHEGSVCFGDAVLAKTQTKGRGRFGRNFFSPAKTGIYLSILLPYEDTQLLTVGAGVAVLKSIEKATGIKTDIKWINDLYLNGRKIAGILAEAITNEDGVLSAVILGVGINIAYPAGDFPQEIKETAGVLFPGSSENALKEEEIENLIKKITASLIENLAKLPEQAKNKMFLQEYKSHLINPQDVPDGVLE